MESKKKKKKKRKKKKWLINQSLNEWTLTISGENIYLFQYFTGRQRNQFGRNWYVTGCMEWGMLINCIYLVKWVEQVPIN